MEPKKLNTFAAIHDCVVNEIGPIKQECARYNKMKYAATLFAVSTLIGAFFVAMAPLFMAGIKSIAIQYSIAHLATIGAQVTIAFFAIAVALRSRHNEKESRKALVPYSKQIDLKNLDVDLFKLRRQIIGLRSGFVKAIKFEWQTNCSSLIKTRLYWLVWNFYDLEKNELVGEYKDEIDKVKKANVLPALRDELQEELPEAFFNQLYSN